MGRGGGDGRAAIGYALAQALDNLIVNAIEHGGPVDRRRSPYRRRPPADRGAAIPGAPRDRDSRRETPAELIARLTGRRRRGHGLRVVQAGRRRPRRRVRPAPLRLAGPTAVLELPLLRVRRRRREPARPRARLPARGAAGRGRCRGDRRRLRRAASPAATAGCGRWWSPSPSSSAGRAIDPALAEQRLEVRQGAGPVRAAGGAGGPGRSARPGAGDHDPGRLLPARLAAAAARPDDAPGPASAGAGARSRSPSAAPGRCWRSGPSRSGRRVDVVVTTRTVGRRRRAAPTSPPPAVPLLALGPGADGPGPGGTVAGDPRPDPGARRCG